MTWSILAYGKQQISRAFQSSITSVALHVGSGADTVLCCVYTQESSTESALSHCLPQLDPDLRQARPTGFGQRAAASDGNCRKDHHGRPDQQACLPLKFHAQPVRQIPTGPALSPRVLNHCVAVPAGGNLDHKKPSGDACVRRKPFSVVAVLDPGAEQPQFYHINSLQSSKNV